MSMRHILAHFSMNKGEVRNIKFPISISSPQCDTQINDNNNNTTKETSYSKKTAKNVRPMHSLWMSEAHKKGNQNIFYTSLIIRIPQNKN